MIIGSRGRVLVALGATALALTVAVPVALLVAAHGFDGLYGQDSFFYHAYATGPLREAIAAGQLPPAFTWPPGYPILVAIGSLLLGTASFVGQVVSLVGGAAVPVATAFLAAELPLATTGTRLRAAVPLLAGALVAVTPHLWQSSAVVMSDTTGLAFATAGAWAVARYARTSEARWAVVASAAVASAIVVRWVYGLAAVPLAVCGLVIAWRAGTTAVRRSITAAHVGVAVVTGVVVMLPLLAPMVVALVSGTPVPFSIQFTAHAWDPLNIVRTSGSGLDGRFAFELPIGLFYLLEPARPYYLGPLFAVGAVFGLATVLRAPSIERLAILVGWPGLVLAFLAGDIYQNTRFALAMLPPVAILAALGTSAIVARAWRVTPPAGRRLVMALGAAIVVGLAAMAVGAVTFTEAFIVRQEAEQAAIRRLAAQVPTDARLVTFGATLSVRQAGRPDAIELYDADPATLVAEVQDGIPTYLLVPVDGLDGQWADEPPGLAFAALRDGPGLTLLDEDGAYRLFVVWSPAGASDLRGRFASAARSAGSAANRG